MSDTTIDVPSDQVEAIREALVAARLDLAAELERTAQVGATGADEPGDAASARRRERLAGVEHLLAQVDAGGVEGERRLTGPRDALWDVLYDSMCTVAEQLEQACNDYWRGEVGGALIRSLIAGLGSRLDSLESIGPPPTRAPSA